MTAEQKRLSLIPVYPPGGSPALAIYLTHLGKREKGTF